MLILSLDTSSPSGSLAVLRDEDVIGVLAASSSEIYSSRIFRQLEFLLGELSIELQDFDLFSVAAGPGSFTGLRVGLAAVKGWAEVYGKPVAAVSALEAVATQSRSRARMIVSVMDARRKELYWGIYRRGDVPDARTLVPARHETVGTREEFVRAVAGMGEPELAIATPNPALLSGAVSQLENPPSAGTRRICVERVSPILAPEIGQLGLRRAREGRLVDSLTLDANYIRRSDAEIHSKGTAGS